MDLETIDILTSGISQDGDGVEYETTVEILGNGRYSIYFTVDCFIERLKDSLPYAREDEEYFEEWEKACVRLNEQIKTYRTVDAMNIHLRRILGIDYNLVEKDEYGTYFIQDMYSHYYTV